MTDGVQNAIARSPDPRNTEKPRTYYRTQTEYLSKILTTRAGLLLYIQHRGLCLQIMSKNTIRGGEIKREGLRKERMRGWHGF